ncbi:hypothetical protein DN752_08325 [Echinicola strongylocentroti]|uniref:Uncharacterized protein n=1 Tax=Echinicola strongylocentroti TaxID=1795355 RepID=A0A2Z4IHF1_9BACT|nr:hypothetical protein [Echinicola strongylocentroti]AWW30127.1 hypothetical protein DN752_08325 [Echinicola strongylocentroti]
MNKQQHPIDKLFRDKLEQHQEKPSGLAWERLESQLEPTKSDNKWGWMRIAAMFMGVMGLVYLLWQYAPVQPPAAPQIAEKTVEKQQLPNKDAKNSPQPAVTDQPTLAEAVEPAAKEVNPESTPTAKQPADQKHPAKTSKASVKPAQKEPQQVQVAERNQKNATIPKADVTPLPQLEVPTPDMDELIAENTTVTTEKEPAVSYKVSIKSSGISEKPKKEKLVEEIGDKINTLGGLLGKVDQGYADLQDAKNNLFAALITKNETK